MQKPANLTKPLQTLERAKGIEPSFSFQSQYVVIFIVF